MSSLSPVKPPASPFGGKLLVSVAGSAVKKKQSSLKALVHQFSDLLASWKNDGIQLIRLVEALTSLYRNALAINRSYYHQLDKSSGLMDSELHQLLLVPLQNDIESTHFQIQNFMYQLYLLVAF
jgi:hypothetical protein